MVLYKPPATFVQLQCVMQVSAHDNAPTCASVGLQLQQMPTGNDTVVNVPAGNSCSRDRAAPSS